ncbi:hypothetical protein KEM55_004297 [Ascosphaera atra]|nr:hypothetical protein KEM55_004297 [Ascosphaera atra]
MPGAVANAADPQSAAMSFADNFWGKDDAGVAPMFERMHNAKLTCDELKTYYNIRANIEEEYSRKLLALSRKPLGSRETCTLRASLDVIRLETETLGKTHAEIAGKMKTRLEEPLVTFAAGIRERRKIVQTGIEKLHKVKVQQTTAVNKVRYTGGDVVRGVDVLLTLTPRIQCLGPRPLRTRQPPRQRLPRTRPHGDGPRGAQEQGQAREDAGPARHQRRGLRGVRADAGGDHGQVESGVGDRVREVSGAGGGEVGVSQGVSVGVCECGG